MKQLHIICSFFCILLLLALSIITECKLLQPNKKNNDNQYIYLGKDVSNIVEVISMISALDHDRDSLLHEFKKYGESGGLFISREEAFEILEYAAILLQRDGNLLKEDTLEELSLGLDDVLNKFFNEELTIDQSAIDNSHSIAHRIRTLFIDENLNVAGKTTLQKHLNIKQGAHVQGHLKVDKSANFKQNVTVEGILSVTDLVVLSCMDNLCVNNLSVTNVVIEALDVSCDLTVGCNISLNDSTSAAVGNIIKNGVSFIHDFGSNDTFVGINSGNFTMTGFNNTAMGINTLSSNTLGYNNTVMGSNAMQNNITGYQNSAIGQGALQNNTIGTNNTAMGNIALSANISGINNTGIGSGALNANDVGAYNTAVGHAALLSNTAGFQNVAVGEQALFFNTTGFYNTAIGQGAMLFNTTGSYNTVTGTGALVDNTTGIQNSALGYSALSSNITGSANTAVGYLALNLNAVDGNTAVGTLALSANTTGFNNTAVGLAALENNSIGPNNVAIGSFALQANTVGNQNTAIGVNALQNNAVGSSNTAIGQGAMASNTTGFNNTAVGDNTLVSNTIGIQNSAIGQSSLANNTMGSNNVAVGQGALIACTEGNNNIAFGFQAGDALTSTESNDIYIGNVGVVAESNTTRIGTPAVQTAAFIAGIYNTTTGSATTSPVIVDLNGQLGTIVSSRKFKHDIADMDDASSLLYNLHPVTFVYNHDASGTRQYGLIAEEVDTVFPALVLYDENNQPYTVRYEILPVLLLNELHKQQARFEVIEQRLACLEVR